MSLYHTVHIRIVAVNSSLLPKTSQDVSLLLDKIVRTRN